MNRTPDTLRAINLLWLTGLMAASILLPLKVVPLILLAIVLVVGRRSVFDLKNLLLLTVGVILFVPIGVSKVAVSMPFDMTIDRIVLFAVVTVWIVALLVDPAVRLRRTPFDLPLAFFVLVSFGSIVLNAGDLARETELTYTIKRFVNFLAFPLIFVFIVSILKDSIEAERILKLLAGAVVIIGVGSVFEYFYHVNLFRQVLEGVPLLQIDADRVEALSMRWSRVRIQGPGEHPVAFGALMAMTSPIFFHFLMEARNRWARLWYGFGLLLVITTVLLTISRSSVVALAVIVLITFGYRPRRLVTLLPWILAAPLVVHMLMPGTLSTLRDFFIPDSGIAQESSVAARLEDYPRMIEMFWRKPLVGRGFESVDSRKYFFVDNQYLGFLVEIGTLGLISLAWFFSSIIMSLRRAIRRAPPEQSDLLVGVTAAICAYIVVGFTFDTFAFGQLTYLFFILAGLAAVLAAPFEANRPSDSLEAAV